MTPYDEAAAILNHYFSQLARASGMRWSEHNQADIARAAELLAQPSPLASDEIPPYQPPVVSDRVTQVFDIDPAFERWRAVRREADAAAPQRLPRRNGSQ